MYYRHTKFFLNIFLGNYDSIVNISYAFYLYVLESVWEPPAEGFLSVAEQEAEEVKKVKDKKDKEKIASKKKAPSTGPKAKKKKLDKDGAGDDDDNDNGEEIAEPAPPVRGEFEPFMMETTRIGSWKRVETIA